MDYLIIGFILVVVCSTVTVEVAFVYGTSIMRAIENGVWIPREMKIIGYLLFIVGAPADVIFNWTRGTWEYREFPKWGEWTFSARTERIVNDREHRRNKFAARWTELLNWLAPGHIDLRPPTPEHSSNAL